MVTMGRRAYAIFVLSAMGAILLPGQTVTKLFTFNGTDGEGPMGQLTQGIDGALYGVTAYGGTNLYHGTWGGTIFKVTPGGRLTTLYDFCSKSDCADGQDPLAGLVQATDGNFYGTTWEDTVFRISPSGAFTTLYTFCSKGACADGTNPAAPLIQAADGDLYGTTVNGGATCPNSQGCGTVFKITPNGVLTTLHRFCAHSACADGAHPYAGLVQASDGNLYGTTFASYATGVRIAAGTVFKITPGGTLTTLYNFCEGACHDGAYPGTLVQGPAGNFYGAAAQGGAYRGGTVFEITPSGTLTTLHSFCILSGCADGSNPDGLILGSDGNLYGTTYNGGSFKGGTIFKISLTGGLTTLFNFCSASDWFQGCLASYFPLPLFQDTNGDFYASSEAPNLGANFSLSVGIGPFVKALPHFGIVGSMIRILGTDLTGATSVSFNGTPAAFNVISATEIMATLPAGATTGAIQVTTPGGTLLSAGPFSVVP